MDQELSIDALLRKKGIKKNKGVEGSKSPKFMNSAFSKKDVVIQIIFKTPFLKPFKIFSAYLKARPQFW